MRRAIWILPLLAGCLDSGGEYYYGVDVDDLELVVTGPTMGVYPDTSILDVKQNPFADGVGEARWTTLGDGKFIASFYAWGSDLAMIAEGERQYYTAVSAHQIYELGLCEPSDRVWVREIAIGGYQAMLDNFPEARSYDISGRWSWPLAPLAYQGIVDLGGSPEGDWVLVDTPDGLQLVKP